MAIYLLDTDTVSEPALPRPRPAVMARMQQHRADIALCAPVIHELRYGAERLAVSRRRRFLEAFIAGPLDGRASILSYDRAAAEWHARERARLTAIGRPPPFTDGQIAAIAATNRLVLVTANVADFEHFQDLQIEDWRL